MDLDQVKRYCLLLQLWIASIHGCNRSPPTNRINGEKKLFDDPVIRGRINSALINEISGIANSRRHKDVLYVLNDSGGSPRLFAINATTADLIAILNISGAINCDWEDIAVGPGPWGISYIYIGDVGGNTRSTCNTIYRVREPLVMRDSELSIHGELTYTWTEPNCETLLVDQKGMLYLVSKVRPGNSPKLYQIPNFAWRFRKITLHAGSAINIKLVAEGPVGGDISLSGKEILIKTYNKIYYWKRHLSSALAEVLQKPPKVLPYVTEPQGEAICWSRRDRGYFTISEGPNQPLYYYKRSSGDSVAVVETAVSNFLPPITRGYIDRAILNEISGVSQSRLHKDVLYVLNDSGGKPRIFAVNSTTAHVISIFNISNARNCDWEDISVGPGPEGHNYIYIGDIGGNSLRTCNTIYRVREPEVVTDGVDGQLAIHGEVTYIWEEENSETLMVDESGVVYLVTKVFTGVTPSLYALPPNAWDLGEVTLNSGSAVRINLEAEGPVAGDISSTGKEILIKTYNMVYYWHRANSSTSLSLTLQERPIDLPYKAERQGESICWGWQDGGYYTISEGSSQPLHFYKRTSSVGQ